MTNKEILAELKKSYEYLNDICENGSFEHCNGQLNQEQVYHIHIAMNELAEVYSSFREKLSDNDVQINLKSGTYYIGNCISEDYSELFDPINDETYYVTCADLDYYWYEDDDFLTRNIEKLQENVEK